MQECYIKQNKNTIKYTESLESKNIQAEATRTAKAPHGRAENSTSE